MLIVLAAMLGMCVAGSAIGQTRYYVDGDIDPPGIDGLSWSDAFATIHEALGEAVAGDEIWVKAGTYTPAAPGNRDVSFAIERGIRILGGFVGNEAFPEERDIDANPTILDGDLADDDTPDFGDRGDNSYHVVRVTASDNWNVLNEQAVLDGLIIRGGNADGSDEDAMGGGVLLLDESSVPVERIWLLLQSTRLTDNSADGGGGGIAAYESVVEFRDCLVDNNRALGLENSLRVYGGAGFYAGAVRTTRTVFDSNRAFNFGGGGGTIHTISPVLLFAESYLVNTMFIANRAGDAGGGLVVQSGDVEIANCLAAGNHVELDTGSGSAAVPAGGGFAFRGGEKIVLVNSTIADNTAVNDLPDDGPVPVFSVGLGAGVYRQQGTVVTIRNSILWGNRVTIDAPGNPQEVDHHGAQVNLAAIGSVSTSPIAFCNIQNNIGCGANCAGSAPDQWFNIGHTAQTHDPLFNDPSQWDYRHRAVAMTDSGDDDAVPDDVNDVDENGITAEVLPIDLGGGPRLIATVDMGAYEWCLGDLNLDGSRDGADLGLMLVNWGNPGLGDLNGDGIVDGADLGLLLILWSEPCPTENQPSMLFSLPGHSALVAELLEAFGFEELDDFLDWVDTLEAWELDLLFADLID